MNSDSEIPDPLRAPGDTKVTAAPGSNRPVERRVSWADARIGTRFVLTSVALLFVTFGLTGFFTPRFFGTYLTPARCFFILGCAVIMFSAAYGRSHQRARLVALLLTLLFGGLAAAGFLMGVPGTRHIGQPKPDSHLVLLFAGRLELARNDHSLHLIIASLFLYASLAPRSWDQD